MKIKDVMTPDPQIIAPESPVTEVALLMKEHDVGMIPVCDGDTLQGTITDRDIVLHGVAEGLDLARTRVEEIMNPDVIYCYEDQDTAEAAGLMEAHQVRRLAVLDRDKRLTGILSLGDLAVKSDDQEPVGEALTGISS
jgi:CBS domain-containing protein